MDPLDLDTLSALARHLGRPSITILMPTHRAGADKEQDPIRLKNLLKSAELRLREEGLRQPDIDSLLSPAQEVLHDSGFWRETSDGLALFLAERMSRILKVTASLDEYLHVGERFTIRPLLPSLDTGMRFYTIAISKNSVRAFEGTASEIDELQIAGMPASLAEALQFDDFERHVQFHSRTPAAASGKGRRPAIFHGHGGIPHTEKDSLARFFRMIDKALGDRIRDENAPLVIAGVDYLVTLYREVNSHPGLADEAITGNPDELSARELHTRALGVLQSLVNEDLERDLANLEAFVGTETTSHDLREIVPAAHEGRVRVLFVDPSTEGWGRFDPGSGRVELSSKPASGDWDLVDLAAAETILHGGKVHSVEPGLEQLETAAIFRY